MPDERGLDAALIDEFIDDYFAECDEHLTAVRTNFLILEGYIGRPVDDRGLLDALLRAFHSIKGLSGMVGVGPAEQLAHEVETALRQLGRDRFLLTSELYDALTAATTLLEQVIAARRGRASLPAIAPAIARLEAAGAGSGTGSGAGAGAGAAAPAQAPPPLAGAVLADPSNPSNPSNPTESTVPLSPAAEPAGPAGAAPLELSGEVQARLVAAGERGERAWRFVFRSSADLVVRGINVSSVRSRLQGIGEVIYAAPRVMEGARIAFDFIVVTPGAAPSFEGWEEDGLTWTPYPPNGAAPQGSQAPAVPHGPQPAPPPGGPGGSSGRAFPAPSSERSERGERTERRSTVAPSNMVRVDLARLDDLMQWVGELVISRARLAEQLRHIEPLVPAGRWREVQESSLLLERQLRDLREAAMRVRLVPIGEVFTRMQFVVHDLARASGKKVLLELSGQETEIDKLVVERMMNPLLHLVRNAVSHGLETPAERIALGKPAQGRIDLRAATAGDLVTIEVQDDGRGIDLAQVAARGRVLGLLRADEALKPEQALDLICAPGFSTRQEADLASGRGVGMAVVYNTVRELSGSLSMQTQPGWGTRFIIHLPLTLAILDAVIVSAGGQTFAIPQLALREVIELPPPVRGPSQGEVIPYRGGALPVIRLARLFRLAEPADGRPRHALVVGQAAAAVALAVDRIRGQREIVVRPVTDPLVQTPGIAGATELGDGRPVLILDTAVLARMGEA